MPMPTLVDISFDMPCFLIVGPSTKVLTLGGSLNEAAVVRAGFNFNYPLRVGHVANGNAEKISKIMDTIQFSGSPNMILETVKRGEDDAEVNPNPIKKRDSTNVILRIYEAYGGHGRAEVTT
jgi:alpha-mannosidase